MGNYIGTLSMTYLNQLDSWESINASISNSIIHSCKRVQPVNCTEDAIDGNSVAVMEIQRSTSSLGTM